MRPVFVSIPPLAGTVNDAVGSDFTCLMSSRAEVSLLNGTSGNRISGSRGNVSDLGEGDFTGA